MMTAEPSSEPLLRRSALIGAAGVFVVELIVIGLVFKHGISFTCLENWPRWACSGASGAMIALYCMLGALLLFAVLIPQPVQDLVSEAGETRKPLGLNVLGTILALIPALFLTEGSGTTMLWPALLFWGAGIILLTTGIALYLAPVKHWRRFLTRQGGPLSLVLLTGAIAPWFATQIRPLWQVETLAGATFNAVAWSLRTLGYDPEIPPGTRTIGVDPFYVNVAPVCSGIEGIALVTLFVTLYIALFRKTLRFPHILVLYPLGILTSVLFNIVRITVLLVIGIEGNADLAIGGFHSHAGWLLFTIIAVGIVIAAQTVPVFQKTHDAQSAAHITPALPFFQDPTVARILPFAVFMFSAMLAQAFSNTPGVVYPLRAAAMAAALVLFWRVYLRLEWRLDPVALLTGAAIGLAWALIPYTPEDTTPAYGALTGAALVGWFVVRGVGTILLIPLIEELFFRDYLEGKLRPVAGPIVSVLITAGLFALLHDRWAEAFVAGCLLSWVMQRHGRVTDAIVAHAVANLIVFAAALATGALYII